MENKYEIPQATPLDTPFDRLMRSIAVKMKDPTAPIYFFNPVTPQLEYFEAAYAELNKFGWKLTTIQNTNPLRWGIERL